MLRVIDKGDDTLGANIKLFQTYLIICDLT